MDSDKKHQPVTWSPDYKGVRSALELHGHVTVVDENGKPRAHLSTPKTTDPERDALEAVARAAEAYITAESQYVPVDVLAWGAEMRRTRDAVVEALAKLREVRRG